MREPCRREVSRAPRDEPRYDHEVEAARDHRGILLAQLPCPLGADAEDAEPAIERALAAEEGAGCEQVARLVQLGQVVQMRVLQLARRLLVELGGIIRRQESTTVKPSNSIALIPAIRSHLSRSA
jgi:hypothetical protein